MHSSEMWYSSKENIKNRIKTPSPKQGPMATSKESLDKSVLQILAYRYENVFEVENPNLDMLIKQYPDKKFSNKSGN